MYKGGLILPEDSVSNNLLLGEGIYLPIINERCGYGEPTCRGVEHGAIFTGGQAG